MRTISIHFQVDEKTFSDFVPDDVFNRSVSLAELPLVVNQLMNSAEISFAGAVIRFPDNFVIEVLDRQQITRQIELNLQNAHKPESVLVCERQP